MEKISSRVLVTGGTGVLGGEIVRQLRAQEYSVTACFKRDVGRAESLQCETGCEVVCADAAEEAQVTRLIENFSSLFAVVHAVGVARDELLLRQTRAQWDASLNINADSAFFVARAALQKLQDGGRIIFLVSRVAEIGRAGQSAYAAGKAAQIALMKCAAREGAARGICANAICPGWVPSALNEQLSESQKLKARTESVFGQFGAATEVASLTCWLLSDAAKNVSGQVFHCHSRI